MSRLTRDKELANQVGLSLARFLTPGTVLPGTAPGSADAVGESVAWHLFTRLVSSHRLIDDFHLADRALSDFVVSLAGLTGVSLLVVLTGRPEPFQHHQNRFDAGGYVERFILEPPQAAVDQRLRVSPLPAAAWGATAHRVAARTTSRSGLPRTGPIAAGGSPGA